jgi:hypothetical protein
LLDRVDDKLKDQWVVHAQLTQIACMAVRAARPVIAASATAAICTRRRCRHVDGNKSRARVVIDRTLRHVAHRNRRDSRRRGVPPRANAISRNEWTAKQLAVFFINKKKKEANTPTSSSEALIILKKKIALKLF